MADERAIHRVGTTEGRNLQVACTPHFVVLRDPAVAHHNGSTLNTHQARSLGEALIRAADAVEGVVREG